MKPEEVKIILKETGIKYQTAAQKSKINNTAFSGFLNNRYILNPDEISRLKEYLNKIKTII